MIVNEVLNNYGSFSPDEMLVACLQCMEVSEDGFMTIDSAGNIAYINKAYSDYLGISQDEAIGQPVRKYIPVSEMPAAAQEIDFRELNTIVKVPPQQYVDHEQYIIVNRLNVNYRGKSIGAAGQAKLIKKTIQLSKAISNIYGELEYYRNKLERIAGQFYSIKSIVGESEVINQARSMAIQAAKTDFSVLITGETGTGKEVFANTVHFSSNRSEKPIVRVNCAAIPENLMESELFGYEEGAFTGAKKGGKKGKFELANGGTLFLDEIGELPLFMQAKLLRVLQEKEVERVGGEKPIPVDVRIIAATNKDLLYEIKNKTFRQDLYYRLNVLEIKIPPLRERPVDIPSLIHHFLDEINKIYHTEIEIDPDLIKMLSSYSWPGNVRELKNTIERAYALCTSSMITQADLPPTILKELKNKQIFSDIDLSGAGLEATLRAVEKKLILDELEARNGNMQKTANALGIHRTTLYKRMNVLNIKRDKES